MLPVALENLLFHIMPNRAGHDGKRLGSKIAKSVILRLIFCILTSICYGIPSPQDSGVLCRIMLTLHLPVPLWVISVGVTYCA
eukprot:g17978.t1